MLTAAGTVEMDAGIMVGTGGAGAVGSASRVRSAIGVARAVMERTPHCLLVGPEVTSFAAGAGLEVVGDAYFKTSAPTTMSAAAAAAAPAPAPATEAPKGTVGCCVRDASGGLCAAVSTGGLSGKMRGRVGDSACVSAGFWADPRCAVCTTGYGERFIRGAAAHDVGARVRLLGDSLAAALSHVMGALPEGTGGMIGVDAAGRAWADMNASGMFTGLAESGGPAGARRRMLWATEEGRAAALASAGAAAAAPAAAAGGAAVAGK